MEGGKVLLAAAAVGAGVMALYRVWASNNEAPVSQGEAEAVAAAPSLAVAPVVREEHREPPPEPIQQKKRKKNRRKNKRRDKEEGGAGGAAADQSTRGSKSEQGAHRTLFISGIEEDVPGGGRKLKKSLSAAFARFGPRTVKVCVSHEGRTRGWAHITLSTPDAAAAALAEVGPTLVLDGRTLHVAMAIDKRDILFPSLSADQRARLQLDSVALYSVSDESSSTRIATLLMSIASAAAPTSYLTSSYLLVGDRSRESDNEDVLTMSVPAPRPELVVTDATACVGGMTFPLARTFSRVIAIEFDPTRYNFLMTNGEVCGLTNIEYHSGDYTKLYGDFVQDMVVLDPPWGGPQYTATQLPDLFLGETSLTELALHLRHHCDVLCVRLPLNYNADDLVDRLLSSSLAFSTVVSPPAADATSPPLGGTTHVHDEWVRLTPSRRPGPADSDGEYPFIYRIEFDVTRLLVVCYPPRTRSRVRFSLANLDAVIGAINVWNNTHGKQHHPAFFDWDKRRWIPLSRWRGTAPTPTTRPATAAAAAVSGGVGGGEGGVNVVGISHSGAAAGVASLSSNSSTNRSSQSPPTLVLTTPPPEANA